MERPPAINIYLVYPPLIIKIKKAAYLKYAALTKLGFSNNRVNKVGVLTKTIEFKSSFKEYYYN